MGGAEIRVHGFGQGWFDRLPLWMKRYVFGKSDVVERELAVRYKNTERGR